MVLNHATSLDSYITLTQIFNSIVENVESELRL